MNVHKLREVLGLATLFIAWVIILHIGWMMLYPYEPLVINNIRMFDEHFHPGSNLIYEIDYCKNTDRSAVLTKMYENHIVYRLKSQVSNVEQGCYVKNITMIVPESLPEGRYRICATAEYQMNGMRSITTRYETPFFYVVEEGNERVFVEVDNDQTEG